VEEDEDGGELEGNNSRVEPQVEIAEEDGGTSGDSREPFYHPPDGSYSIILL